MPHAQRTNDVFWTSLNPSMPGLLELYGQTVGGWPADSANQCSQGPVQAGGQATYSQLLNTTAEDGMSYYVVPGDAASSLMYQASPLAALASVCR